jgi:signal transduction histidine kinase/GAF domain-containing protein
MGFQDFVGSIAGQPGDLIYYLVTSITIQIVLVTAVGHWIRHRGDPNAVRMLVAGVGFMLARGSVMFLAVLDFASGLGFPLTAILPPLERFLEFVTVLLAAWAFLSVFDKHGRLGAALLIFTLLLAIAGYAVSAVLWPEVEAQGIAYNAYLQATVWEIVTIAVLGLSLLVNLIWRGDDWWLTFFLLGLWLAGHVGEFLFPDLESHIAGWVRLTNIAALPLLTALVYRRALSAVPVAAGGEDEALEVVSILQVARRIEEARDIDAALELASLTIVRMLGTDMVAIGLPIAGPSRGVRIAALHPPTSKVLSHQNLTLLASEHPLLASVLQTGRVERVYTRYEDPVASTIYYGLGFERPGPLVLQPLIEGNNLLGVMLVGNPTSRRQVTPRDEKILKAVAGAIAASLATARRRGGVDQGAELQKALAEVQRVTQYAAELESELEQQRQKANELNTRLRLQEQGAAAQAQAPAEIAIWQEELRGLAEARARLEAELVEWKERAEQIAHAKAELQMQLAQTRTELQEVQGQAALAPVEQSTDGGGPGGIVVGDGEGKIILVSQGGQYLVGQSRSTLIGTPLQNLFNEPTWVQAVGRLLSGEAQAGDTATATLELDGRTVRAELTRLPDASGWPGALTVMLYLEEGSLLQSGMLVSLIHELRTPMTSINGYTDLLIGEAVGILGETQRQFLLRVKANIERMGGLLDDMVKIVSLDTGREAVSLEPVDISSVIESAIMSLSAQFSERELSVQMSVPPDLPPVHADRDSIYQIVQHLLANACQCSEAGTEIAVKANLEEHTDQIEGLPDYVLVSVTDTGGGIAPEDQRRVFQRLYRADNPLIAGLGETGVGLSIAKALVEAQGGRIWVESEKGVGSTFSFILPLSPEGEGQVEQGFPSLDAITLPAELEGNGE